VFRRTGRSVVAGPSIESFARPVVRKTTIDHAAKTVEATQPRGRGKE
jgi:hypothetical protein